MNDILTVKNLSHSFGETLVLDNVSFQIQSGEVVALIGENGSGKSTLLKLIINQLSIQTGEIILHGQPIQKFNQFDSIGYVPQGGLIASSQFPATALEVVLLRLPKGNFFNFSNKDRVKKAMNALDHVGLKDKAYDLIGNLSGGQLQRVLIAREMIMDPKLLILDEPTTGLDQQSIQTLFTLIEHLQKVHDMTVLMVTHQIEDMNQCFTKTYKLKYGELTEVHHASI